LCEVPGKNDDFPGKWDIRLAQMPEAAIKASEVMLVEHGALIDDDNVCGSNSGAGCRNDARRTAPHAGRLVG